MMLHGDATTEGFDARNVAVRDRLTVIEEPVQIAAGDRAMDLFEDLEGTPNRLVVGRVPAEFASYGNPSNFTEPCCKNKKPVTRRRIPSPLGNQACRKFSRNIRFSNPFTLGFGR